MSYESFKKATSSTKVTLARIEGSVHMKGWTPAGECWSFQLHHKNLKSITQEDVQLEQVPSLEALQPGTFFVEGSNCYLRTLEDTHPDGEFLFATFSFHFSTMPVALPRDLGDGDEIFWEPMIRSTSSFGVEIDTVNQASEAIEGSGDLTLFNDHDFWPKNYDKIFFENHQVEIFSYSPGLAPSEAKLLFSGRIESKSYSPSAIGFKLKDLLSSLKDALPLKNISELGLRHQPADADAKQRILFGEVIGHKPINVDQVLNGSYPITGMLSVTLESAEVTGLETKFLKELSPEDRIRIDGRELTISEVPSDTSLILSDIWPASDFSGPAEVVPHTPRRYTNRTWCVAGHALREPRTVVSNTSSTLRVSCESTRDINPGDKVYVGTYPNGEVVRVARVQGTHLVLAESLHLAPTIGTEVLRPSIQNLFIHDTELVYGRDFTYNPETAMLYLEESAEAMAAPVKESIVQATFTSGSRVVEGTETFFKSFLKAGDMIRPRGAVAFWEVLYVETDERVILRSPYTETTRTVTVQYKDLIYTPGETELYCDVLGMTFDDTPSGVMPKTASQINLKLLKMAGLEDHLNLPSFHDGASPEELSVALPRLASDKSTPIFRSVINQVNRSVFGILLQDNNFKLTFQTLRPRAHIPARLDQSDLLDFQVRSTNKNMIRTAVAQYGWREFDLQARGSLELSVSSTSQVAEYILKTGKQRVFPSLLRRREDAARLAGRWSFLLSHSTNQVSLKTKLQAIDLQINDIIAISHPKLFERYGGKINAKVVLIERIKKSGSEVLIEATDLSNAFNRVAIITSTHLSWSDASDEIRMTAGFITDQYGLIDGDPDSYGVNLIW